MHNNNINNNNSQIYNYVFFSFFSLLGLVILLILQTPLIIKLILGIFCALIPLFWFKPETFLYFIFLFTPAIRDLAATETVFQNYSLNININVILSLSILILGGLFILRQKKPLWKIIKTKPVFNYLLFLLLAAGSLAYSLNQFTSLQEVIRSFNILIIFIYTFLSISENKQRLYPLLAAMIIGAFIPALIGLIELFQGAGWYDETLLRNRINASFLHPATLAFYLIATLPIMLGLAYDKNKKQARPFLAMLFILFSFIIAATLARDAWIGYFAVLFMYGIFKNRKFLIGMLTVLFIAYILIPSINTRINDVINPKYNSAFTARIEIIKKTLPAFYEAPILGYGYGNFGEIHVKHSPEAATYKTPEDQQAHNDYYSILIELGLVGLVLYLLIYLNMLLYLKSEYFSTNDVNYKNHLFSLFILWVSILAISFGDNIFRTMPLQYLIWAYTGAVFGLKSPERETPKQISASSK